MGVEEVQNPAEGLLTTFLCGFEDLLQHAVDTYSKESLHHLPLSPDSAGRIDRLMRQVRFNQRFEHFPDDRDCHR
jgi:hypothetical protein